MIDTNKATMHTSGPWNYMPTSIGFAITATLMDRVGTPTIMFAETCDHIDVKDTEANARLIAAAPEMYDALKEVERHCPCGARPESPQTHPHVSGCPVGLAIAKAEGA